MKSSRDSAQRSANKREFSVAFQLSASFAALTNIFIFGNREKVLHVHSVITFAFCNIFQDKRQQY